MLYSHAEHTYNQQKNLEKKRTYLSSSIRRSLYNEPLNPASNPSLSPGGSPLREGPQERSALPSPADWSEFINASNSKVERDLAQLTLSDPEQRELYEAARLVQTAFRKYKVQARPSGAYAVCPAARSEGAVLLGLVLLDGFAFGFWRHVEGFHFFIWFPSHGAPIVAVKFRVVVIHVH